MYLSTGLSRACLNAQVALEHLFPPEVGGRPTGHDLATVHEVHGVGELECSRDVLLDDQQGGAADSGSGMTDRGRANLRIWTWPSS